MPETAPSTLDPEHVFPPEEPETLPHPGAEQTNRTGRASRFAGALLTEHVTTINWEALEEVIPSHAGETLGAVAAQNATFMPALAGQIAHRLEPGGETPALVTADQVKEVRPGLGYFSRALSALWPGLGDHFDRFIAGKAQKKVDVAADRAATFVNTVGASEAPKEAFVSEVRKVYDLLGDGLHGEKPETALGNLLWDASEVNERWPQVSYRAWMVDNCPLLLSSLSLLMTKGLREKMRHPHYAKAVAPEVIRGLRDFLQQHTEGPVELIETDQKVPFLRRMALRHRKQTVDGIPDKLVQALNKAHSLLPEDGSRFKQEIVHTAKRAAAIGDPKRLVQALFSPKVYRHIPGMRPHPGTHAQYKEDADDDDS